MMSTVSDPRFETRDPRFEKEYRDEAAPPKKRSPWATCLIGCLVVVVLAMVLFGVFSIWLYRNWRAAGATVATQAMNEMIDVTDLPAEERQELKLEVRRVADAFRDGEVSFDQLMLIIQDVVESPLFTLFVASAVDKQYLDDSGLSEEEKEEGRLTLRRFVRGAVDEKIDQAAIDSVLEHIADKQPDGTWELRNKVSDEELRAALAKAKQAADEAEVAEEPETVDASAEFKRIVDEAMGVEVDDAGEGVEVEIVEEVEK